jgi:hypothetical protein
VPDPRETQLSRAPVHLEIGMGIDAVVSILHLHSCTCFKKRDKSAIDIVLREIRYSVVDRYANQVNLFFKK